MDRRQLYLILENHLNSWYSKDELSHLTRLIESELQSLIKGTPAKDKQTDASYNTLLLPWIAELKTGKPIQYVLGKAWFMELELSVSPDVLIPRPETEELVELISARESNPGLILDIGTGSGCIALALQKKFPNASVWGTDISDDALVMARTNSLRLDLPVQFLKSDIVSHWQELPEGADILVSNPPYIPVSEAYNMSKSVTAFEPSMALFAPNNDPLVFYRSIHRANSKVKPGGRIYLEVNQYLAEETAALFLEPEFIGTNILTDLSGNPRFVVTSKC